MLFSCDGCGTTYSIPDERVLGRVLKVRCKRCREVVEVIGPPSPNAPGALEPALQVSVDSLRKHQDLERHAVVGAELEHRLNGVHLPAQLSDVKKVLEPKVGLGDDGEHVWFAGIKGRTIGPLSRDDLVIMAKRGTVHERTYVWRAGMPSWQRVERGSNLAFLRQEVQARRERVAQPRRLTGMESGVFVTSGIFDIAAYSEQMSGSFRTAQPTGAHGVSGPAHAFAPRATAERAGAPPPPAGEGAYPIMPPLRTGGSGWFVVSEAGQHELWAQHEVPDVPGTTPNLTGRHLLPRRRRLAIVLVAVAVVTLFAAGIAFGAWISRHGLADTLVKHRASAASASSYNPQKATVASVRRQLDPSRGGGVLWPSQARVDRLTAEDQDDQAPNRAPVVHGTPLPIVTMDGAMASPQSTGRGLHARPAEETMTVAAIDVWLEEKGRQYQAGVDTAPQAVLPELAPNDGPTPGEIGQAVLGRRAQLESCYTAALKRNPGLTGSVETTIVVGLDGHVRSVKVDQSVLGGQLLQQCLQDRMGRWTFGRPNSELEVVIPLRLSRVR